MRKYDLIVPLGNFCLPSHWLRESGLQFVSYPFDWVGTDDVAVFVKYLENHFQGFFPKDYLESNNTIVGTHVGYVDKKNKVLFFHCIDKDIPFDEAYTKANAMFGRRIERLYQNIAQAKKILFFNACYKTYVQHKPEEILAMLQKIFPDKDISLLQLNLAPEFDGVSVHEDGKNIIVYNLNYDMDKNIYTDRDAEMVQIMANFKLRPSKKLAFYKLGALGLAVKRFIVNLLCCFVPVKKARKAIRHRFHISTKQFDRG